MDQKTEKEQKKINITKNFFEINKIDQFSHTDQEKKRKKTVIIHRDFIICVEILQNLQKVHQNK